MSPAEAYTLGGFAWLSIACFFGSLLGRFIRACDIETSTDLEEESALELDGSDDDSGLEPHKR